MKVENDLQLIEAVKKSQVEAFSVLVDKYRDMVYSVALRLLKNPQDAEEMAQEAFVKAYQKISTFSHKSKFSTWVYSIVYHLCISELRKKKVMFISLEEERVSEKDDSEISAWSEDISHEEMEKYLKMALSSIPEDDQVLLILHYYEDQSVEEISRIMNLTASNVKVKMHRARKKIYQLMHEMLKNEIPIAL